MDHGLPPACSRRHHRAAAATTTTAAAAAVARRNHRARLVRVHGWVCVHRGRRACRGAATGGARRPRLETEADRLGPPSRRDPAAVHCGPDLLRPHLMHVLMLSMRRLLMLPPPPITPNTTMNPLVWRPTVSKSCLAVMGQSSTSVTNSKPWTLRLEAEKK